jgi:hypothetical protein
MHRKHALVSWLAALATVPLLSACGDDAQGPDRPDGDAAEAGSLPAPDTGSVDTSAETGAMASPAGIVVVGSDYSSSSVSLLDRDGNLLLDGCLNSSTGGLGLSMTLSGDVVLPTEVMPGGPIPIIDRQNNAVAWIDPATCAVRGQLAVGTGFAANPHDVVTLGVGKAYVTRQGANPKATVAPDDFDDGNDVLIVDPARLTLVGRIDLVPFAPADVLPCADRAVLAEGKVIVSLNAIDAHYTTYGTGRLVVIDPSSDQVTGTIDLPGMKNCGAMSYVSEARRLFVACGGAYGDPAGQAASAGVVAVDLSQIPPVVVGQVGAATIGGAPYSNLTVAALSGATVLAVATGDFTGNPPDGLWSLSFPTGVPAKIFASAEGLALGAVLFDRQRQRAFVADGTMNTPAYLRTFDYANGVFTAGATNRTNPAQKLPPRALALY